MVHHGSTSLGPLTGLILGVALSACAAPASAPRPLAADESHPLPVAGPAPLDARPELRPSHERATAARKTHGRAQPADARRTIRPSHSRATDASAAERVHAEVDRRTRTLDASLRARIAREILEEAARARLDPLLVVALIHVESSFDPDAVSSAGAAGLMQLRGPTMGDVAARFGLHSADPLDPVANIQAGVRYLSGLIRAFEDAELALMAYNAGPGRIRRHLREGGVPERFRAYPQSVARELARLGGSLEPAEPAPARIVVRDAPLARARVTPGPARERIRTLQSPPRVDVLARASPSEEAHSGKPEHGMHHQRYEQALAGKFLADVLAP